MRTGKEGYVYFLKAAESSLVKIGKTNDIKARKKGIQTMSPVHLYTIGALSCVDRHKLERDLHELFAPLRSHGEWFDFEGRVGSLKKCFRKKERTFPYEDFERFWKGNIFDKSNPSLQQRLRWRKARLSNSWRV